MTKNHQIELEKTYLLKYIPADLKNYSFVEIIDIYIPRNADHPKLRIRKNNDEYEICKKYPVKTGDASKQHEFTVPLTQEEFLELNANLEGKRARKLRYLYKFQGKLAEIDVFQDELKGLILADFEFKTKQEKDLFKLPDFCLAEVTQEKIVAGGMIVGKRYAEIEPILAKYSYKALFLD